MFSVDDFDLLKVGSAASLFKDRDKCICRQRTATATFVAHVIAVPDSYNAQFIFVTEKNSVKDGVVLPPEKEITNPLFKNGPLIYGSVPEIFRYFFLARNADSANYFDKILQNLL